MWYKLLNNESVVWEGRALLMLIVTLSKWLTYDLFKTSHIGYKNFSTLLSFNYARMALLLIIVIKKFLYSYVLY